MSVSLVGVTYVPVLLIVYFIVLTLIRFFGLLLISYDFNNTENIKGNTMKNEKTTKNTQTLEAIGLYISSFSETVWAIGVAVISTKLLT